MLLVYLNNQMGQKYICILLLQLYTINQFWTTEYLNLKSKAIKFLDVILQVFVKYCIQKQKQQQHVKYRLWASLSAVNCVVSSEARINTREIQYSPKRRA